MYPASKNIFIVEDNEIYSMMLDYFLSRESHFRFFSFRSGEECLENLHLNPYVIILDYGLPGINGYQTLLELKKRNSKAHIVVLTSNDDCEVAARFFKSGADDYILKEGAGEAQIIEKIETILAEDEVVHSNLNTKKMIYFIVFTALIIMALIFSSAWL